jgi:hypothetical protein
MIVDSTQAEQAPSVKWETLKIIKKEESEVITRSLTTEKTKTSTLSLTRRRKRLNFARTTNVQANASSGEIAPSHTESMSWSSRTMSQGTIKLKCANSSMRRDIAHTEIDANSFI